LLGNCAEDNPEGPDPVPPSKVSLTQHQGDTGDRNNQCQIIWDITDNNNGIDASPSSGSLLYNWMKIQWNNQPLIEDADIAYIEVYRFADHDTTNIKFVGSLPYAPDSSKFIDKFSGVQSPSDKILSYFIIPYDEAGNSTKSDTVSYKLIDKIVNPKPDPGQEFTTDEEITFDWERISTSTYRLLIFDTTHTLQQSINNIDSTSFTTTPSDMGLPFSGTYLWRLDSFGEAVGGSESDEQTIIFTTKK